MRTTMGKIVSPKKARATLLVVLLGTTAAGVVAQVALDGTSPSATAVPAPMKTMNVDISAIPETDPVEVGDVAEIVVAETAAIAVIEPIAEPAAPAAPAIDLTESLSMIGRGDIIRRQALISERKLILDREAQLIESIQAIVDEVGMEGLTAFYPELAVLVQDSPMALRAEIDRAELLAEIKALADEAKPEIAEEEPAAEAEALSGLQGIMEATVAPVGASVDDDPLAEMRAREAALDELRRVTANAPQDVEPAPASLPSDLFRQPADLQVIEIYGLAGDLRAVVSDGPGVTATLRAGDVLRNASVLAVGPSGLTVSIDTDPTTDADAPIEGQVAIRR